MIRYGIALPHGDVKNCARLAQMAEAAGWDGFFVGDAIWCIDPLISLTAAAMVTNRIRLGTMVLAMPLHVPWHLAGEITALDNFSDGRMIMGMGTGAVWMGWHAFPDVVTDVKTRAEMLDEAIDVITLLFQRRPFDFDGKHYHLKLTQMDVMHYPNKPVQQPRVPMWVVGAWPRRKSMERILKCDGLLPMKINEQNEFEKVQPDDIRAMKAYIDANRTRTTPLDIVVEGQTTNMSEAQMEDTIQPYIDAGITWWIEGLWGIPTEQLESRLMQGPPQFRKKPEQDMVQ